MGFADTQLKSNVKTVLSESAISWLNFKCGGVTISTTNYTQVKDYIDNAKIFCKVDPDHVTNGASAVYDFDAKTIYAIDADLQYYDQKSTLIHECTHAQMDIQKVSTTVLNDETCAYLAQALYIAASKVVSNFKAGGLAAEAYKAVTAKNLTFTGQSNLTSPIDFTSADVAALQKKIKLDPLYKNSWSGKSTYKGFP